MVTLETIAETALRRDALHLRSLVQDFLRANPRLYEIPRPATSNKQYLSIAAAFVELFAQRSGQLAPPWTRDIGAVTEPFFLVEAASGMKRLRTLCESETPEPLRKRGLYAPPNFLAFA